MKHRIKNTGILFFLLPFLWACKNDEPTEIIQFSDDQLFEVLLKQGIDSNHDGFISVEEAERVGKITILAAYISDFGELAVFPNLDSLILKMIPNQNLNLSDIPGLRYFECTLCDLTNIDLSGNVNLEEINCEKNQLELLILPSGTALKTLRCSYNRLRELDISGNPALVSLHCDNNLLTRLDLTNNLQLTRMISCVNQLVSLDVSKNKSITLLGVDNMPMLTKVFVWTLPFPPEGVKVLMGSSPRINFMLPD
jgi:hypothetical protein